MTCENKFVIDAFSHVSCGEGGWLCLDCVKSERESWIKLGHKQAAEKLERVGQSMWAEQIRALSPAVPAEEQIQKNANSVESARWYCADCERFVDPREVTFNEAHMDCGRIITNDEPPTNAKSVEELRRKAISDAVALKTATGGCTCESLMAAESQLSEIRRKALEAAQKLIAEMEDANRWRKWPEEKPPMEGEIPYLVAVEGDERNKPDYSVVLGASGIKSQRRVISWRPITPPTA